MKLHCSAYIIIALLLLAGHAHAQKWVTSEVAEEVGQLPCKKCVLGNVGRDIIPVQIGKGRISPVTLTYFDTIATYAQGRIVDVASGKPIKGAVIQTQYTCMSDCGVKTAAANEAGFFRLGWVGCNSSHSNRQLFITAPGYQSIKTTAAKFGGGAYLHIELAALPKRR